MKDIKSKINSKSYMSDFIPSLRNYKILIELCKADMRSQSEEVIRNGEVIDSKKSKLESFAKIEELIELAYDFVLNLKY